MNNKICENHILRNVSTCITLVLFFLTFFVFGYGIYHWTNICNGTMNTSISIIFFVLPLLFLLSIFVGFYFKITVKKYLSYSYVGKNTVTPHLSLSTFSNNAQNKSLAIYKEFNKFENSLPNGTIIKIYSAIASSEEMRARNYEGLKSNYQVMYIRKLFYILCVFTSFILGFLNPCEKDKAKCKKLFSKRLDNTSRFNMTWYKTVVKPDTHKEAMCLDSKPIMNSENISRTCLEQSLDPLNLSKESQKNLF